MPERGFSPRMSSSEVPHEVRSEKLPGQKVQRADAPQGGHHMPLCLRDPCSLTWMDKVIHVQGDTGW